MLCELCTSIFSRVEPRAGVSYQHHQNQEILRKAIQDGCYICSLLGERVALHNPFLGRVLKNIPEGFAYGFSTSPSSKLEQELSGLSIYHKYGPPLGLRIFPAVGYSLLTSQWVELIFAQENASFLSPHQLSQNTMSKESFEQISEWLQNCLESHSNCLKPETKKWLPKRLVFVGKPESGEDIRLCEHESIQEYNHYITLSHRWGQKPVFCLKLENIQDLRRKISIFKLPQNFQDAILITRKLGIKYIWIDSLCIIQDSRNDWLQESGHMCSIYKYALCNLAATGFENGEEGLFTSRNPTLTAPCTINMTYAIRTGQDEQFTTNHKPIGLIEENFWKTDVSLAPLNRRAWVVQERAMSPRTVHFGKRQLFWECKRLTASETFPEGFLSDLDRTQTENFPKHFDLPISRLTQGPRTKVELKRDLYRRWELLIETYTLADLTYSSDKLIAISGLAMEFRSLLGNEHYLAGLWKGNLGNGLLWTAAWDPNGSFRSSSNNTCAGYRAPTWSWASMDSYIQYQAHVDRSRDARTRIRILEAETITENGDDTMTVTGGFVRVEGFVKRVCMQVVMHESLPAFRSTQLWAVEGSRMRSEMNFKYDFRCLNKLKDNEKNSGLDPFENIVDQPNIPTDGVIFCLLVQSSDINALHAGLALVPTGSKGRFQRIGWFEHSYSKYPSERYIWETPGLGMEETYYHSSDGSGGLVIDIV